MFPGSTLVQILARDSKSNDEKNFVTVDSKIVQPLEFFTVSEVDFASGRVSAGWERAPDMSVVLELRLEADASQQGSLFGRGRVSKRVDAVSQRVRIL